MPTMLNVFCAGTMLLGASYVVQAQSGAKNDRPNPQPDRDSAGAYLVGDGVSAPSVISKVEPTYSQEARNAELQGTVVLSLVVSAQGFPQNLKVLRSLGLGLDENAIEAVEKWRFKPGTKDGKPVPVTGTVELNFRLLGTPQVPPSPTSDQPVIAQAVTLTMDQQIDALVKDQSGLIKVTRQGGNILEFDLRILSTFGPVIAVPIRGRFTYVTSKDVHALKNDMVSFTDGPQRSWDSAGTKTLQFRLLDGDTVPASAHFIFFYE